MCWRCGILLVVSLLVGCNGTGLGGPARVPPPGTGAYGQPNNYYQPPAQPMYVPPTYGAQPGAPAAGAAGATPGFGQANPTANNSVSFAPSGAAGSAWQPVTRPATIGGTINPQTTLTTVRGPNTPTANPFVGANGLPEMTSTPRTAAAPTNSPPPASYNAPAYNPAYPPVNYGGASAGDPWRGR